MKTLTKAVIGMVLAGFAFGVNAASNEDNIKTASQECSKAAAVYDSKYGDGSGNLQMQFLIACSRKAVQPFAPQNNKAATDDLYNELISASKALPDAMKALQAGEMKGSLIYANIKAGE